MTTQSKPTQSRPTAADDARDLALLMAERERDLKASGATKWARDPEIIAIVDRYFRKEVLPKLSRAFPGLERRTKANTPDVSLRYSEVLGNFFKLVLEKRGERGKRGDIPLDQFWRAKSTKDLVRWSNVVLANQIRQYYRDTKLRRTSHQAIGVLAEERAAAFERRHPDVRLETMLEAIERWRCLPAPHSMWARLLRLRYVDGCAREEIAAELGITEATYGRQHTAAIEAIRAELAYRKK